MGGSRPGCCQESAAQHGRDATSSCWALRPRTTPDTAPTPHPRANEPGGGVKRSLHWVNSSSGLLTTYLNSVPQVLPEHKRLLCKLLLLTALLRSTAGLIFLRVFLLVIKQANRTTEKKPHISPEKRDEPSHTTAFAWRESCGAGPGVGDQGDALGLGGTRPLQGGGGVRSWQRPRHREHWVETVGWGVTSRSPSSSEP